jgi:hypothetical protein
MSSFLFILMRKLYATETELSKYFHEISEKAQKSLITQIMK